MNTENEIFHIEKAEYIKDYIISLHFSDGKVRFVDFKPFLSRSLNPMIRKYLNLGEFKNFSIEYGDLFWNDYDLCFPVADLYDGSI